MTAVQAHRNNITNAFFDSGAIGTLPEQAGFYSG